MVQQIAALLYRNFWLRGGKGGCVRKRAGNFCKAMPIFRCIILHALVSSLYCGLVCIEGYM